MSSYVICSKNKNAVVFPPIERDLDIELVGFNELFDICVLNKTHKLEDEVDVFSFFFFFNVAHWKSK